MKTRLIYWLIIFYISLIQPLSAQWVQTNGPFYGDISGAAVYGNNVYLGSNYSGIYISTDNGEHWSQRNNGLGDMSVQSLLTVGSNMYAGTFNQGVFLSSDAGSNWSNISDFGLLGCYALAWNSPYLFVGALNGVFRTSDNGNTWIKKSQGITDTSIGSLLVSGSTLFAGTYTGGIFRSTNNGDSWAAVNTGIPNTDLGHVVRDMTLVGSTIVAGTGVGVFMSNNNGVSWNNISTNLHSDYGDTAIWYLKSDGNNIFANTSSDFEISTNMGSSWTSVLKNNIYSLVRSGSILVAGCGDGAFISRDNGSTWTLSNNGLVNTSVLSFLIDDSSITAATSPGVYQTTDLGTTWHSIANYPLYSYSVYDIISLDSNLFAATSNGIYRTVKGSNKWNPVNNGLVTPLWCFDFHIWDSLLFVGTFTGVYCSNDQGTSWQLRSSGLPPAGGPYVRSIIHQGGYLYAATSGSQGIFRSMDHGFSWIPYNTGLGNKKVNVLKTDGFLIYAGTQGGIFRSVNGADWQSMNNGITDTVVNTLLVDGQNLYAGTSMNIYFSMTNGWYWQEIKTGLPAVGIKSIALKNGNLYCGTVGNGVWRRPLNEIITTNSINPNEQPTKYYLSQNYPNPFNPSTTISFTLPTKTYVTLKIFDIIGREVFTLINAEMSSGNHSLQWDANNVTSGVYFYRLQAGSYSETKKIILLR